MITMVHNMWQRRTQQPGDDLDAPTTTERDARTAAENTKLTPGADLDNDHTPNETSPHRNDNTAAAVERLLDL